MIVKSEMDESLNAINIWQFNKSSCRDTKPLEFIYSNVCGSLSKRTWVGYNDFIRMITHTI